MRASSSSSIRFLALALGLAGSLSAIACGSADDVGTPGGSALDDAEVASTEAEVRASCTNPRLYYAVLHEARACEPIEGRRGRWVPEAIFADSPEDVAEGTCAYRWVGARYSRADREALVGAVGSLENALTPVCGNITSPELGEVREIPALDIFGHAGSAGCDVCGKLRRDRIKVILPPDKIAARQFMIPLSNGRARFFEIEPTEARALTIELPPAPPGTFYEPGRIHIY